MSNKGLSQRQLRVGEQIRHVLARILQKSDIFPEDFNSALISISQVRMSPDLKIATCYVTSFDREKSSQIVQILEKHARFLRGEATNELRQLKYLPIFRFRLDDSFDNFSKIDALLKSPAVARDLKKDDDESS